MCNGYLRNHKIGNPQKPVREKNSIYVVKTKVHLHVNLKVSLLKCTKFIHLEVTSNCKNITE